MTYHPFEGIMLHRQDAVAERLRRIISITINENDFQNQECGFKSHQRRFFLFNASKPTKRVSPFSLQTKLREESKSNFDSPLI